MILELTENSIINTDYIVYMEIQICHSGIGHDFNKYIIHMADGKPVYVSEPIYYAIRNFVLHGEVNKNLTIWQKFKILCLQWLKSIKTMKLSSK